MWRALKGLYADIPLSVWLLNIITFISKCGSVVLIFLPFYLSKCLHFELAKIGNILSMYGFGAIAGALLGGYFAERFGCVKVQNLSLLFTGVTVLFIEFSDKDFYIASLIFLHGVFVTAIRPASAEIIASLCHADIRSKAYALNYQAINLGCTIGPALGGFIAKIDYVWIFRLNGVANIGAAIFMFYYFFHQKEINIQPTAKRPAMSLALKDFFFIKILFLSLCIGLCFFQLFSMYPLYLKDYYTIGEKGFGALMAFGGALIIIFQLPLLMLVKRFSRIRLIAIGSAIIGAGFAILPLSTNISVAIISMMIITTGEMLVLPLINDLVASIASKEARGSYFGFFSCVFALPLILCPLLGSWISIHFGAKILWYIVGVVAVIAALGFEFVNSLRREDIIIPEELAKNR